MSSPLIEDLPAFTSGPLAPDRLRLLHPVDDSGLSWELKPLPVETLGKKTFLRALPYVWDPANRTDLVEVIGCKLEVHYNLYTALPYLARRQTSQVLGTGSAQANEVNLEEADLDGVPDAHDLSNVIGYDELPNTPIWIEAICINQKDEGEKGSQIPFMNTIYRKASMVWMWMGLSEDQDFIQNAIEWFPAIKEAAAHLAQTYDGYQNYDDCQDILACARRPRLDRKHGVLFCTFWTTNGIAEYGLSKNLRYQMSLYLCGVSMFNPDFGTRLKPAFVLFDLRQIIWRTIRAESGPDVGLLSSADDRPRLMGVVTEILRGYHLKRQRDHNITLGAPEVEITDAMQVAETAILDKTTAAGRFVEHTIYTQSGRQVIFTTNGVSGFATYGDPGVLPGDRVIVFNGAPTPHIVRRIAGRTDETYQLIADAYVYGLMNGEVDHLKLKDQDIVLV
ncbi:heterokaryon incompatibility protein [Stagonosporopsis vannaccii]|nr:heterokaryon incompatibility protein [Stagonosporopsis vannaccii]